ncbi:hypothetical protein DWX43_17095 [Clostridium sp. AF19-22AC]|jgi:hypothetical protein|nr:hypothetical protein DWX43_17095 [Clostridium sp. AF19-22AC]
MNGQSHPMVYVLIGRSQEDHLTGYVTNSEFLVFYPFFGITNMVQEVSNLMRDSLYFQAGPKKMVEHTILPKLRSRRLFIIEILYQQNHDWQGYIRGISSLSKCTFKSREEMKDKIKLEMDKRRDFRKTL